MTVIFGEESTKGGLQICGLGEKKKIPVCRAFSWNFMGVLQLRARYKLSPIFEPYK